MIKFDICKTINTNKTREIIGKKKWKEYIWTKKLLIEIRNKIKWKANETKNIIKRKNNNQTNRRMKTKIKQASKIM